MESRFIQISLKELLKEIGLEETKKILSDFSCVKSGNQTSLNCDVESFLVDRASIYEEADQSRTILFFTYSTSGDPIIAGYYSITQRQFQFNEDVDAETRISLSGHETLKKGPLNAMLIGQIGKNYSINIPEESRMQGKELLHYALLHLKKAYEHSPFRLIYLECKDNDKLKQFYGSQNLTLHANKSGNAIKNQRGLIKYYVNVSILESIN